MSTPPDAGMAGPRLHGRPRGGLPAAGQHPRHGQPAPRPPAAPSCRRSASRWPRRCTRTPWAARTPPHQEHEKGRLVPGCSRTSRLSDAIQMVDPATIRDLRVTAMVAVAPGARLRDAPAAGSPDKPQNGDSGHTRPGVRRTPCPSSSPATSSSSPRRPTAWTACSACPGELPGRPGRADDSGVQNVARRQEGAGVGILHGGGARSCTGRPGVAMGDRRRSGSTPCRHLLARQDHSPGALRTLSRWPTGRRRRSRSSTCTSGSAPRPSA
ncbi:hypothetical protein QJS66_10225 [Kocuria rhizophila]|nr:hypothetical protein QJS66_10225 [Kocuria rhizophila]